MLPILIILFGYLAGSIPSGVWYSKYIHNVDVRTLGSGNSGGTNVGRNFGPFAAIVVVIVDVLKGFIPVLLAQQPFLSGNDLVIMLTGLAAVLGHAYPLFSEFRGGKIVATSVGVLLAFNFYTALAMIVAFFAILFTTSTVSIAAMASFLLSVIWIILNEPLVYAGGFALMAILMIYRHRDNIRRILKGDESRVTFGLHPRKK
ncbi:glycerol-3-phosphate 1-O-acyltransferase PlsY [Facklamia miroungae]|uniref:Glycerol-3-phosphate acyltransferase n=1 Tax=Facklamia miroungae TaxID=120956 RepID=A0A1G7P7Y5_9LACT|nr:glycerol-3-phosphate 1-O-acyltransferase PlsY [Facklamia miroungae]NKZ28615.1 glycerol-3-phosphate 1-O-acyltransferase PlsY [Facklamia miroungae]SDF82436.1 glycerol-3-phosphate acyltransferase PlsY [Facklamia miroungae]